VNLYERLGRDVFVQLSTEFYNRIYADTEKPEFLQNFLGRDKNDAIRNQYEFFIQRMGGPPLFSQRRGHPALIGRHIQFDMRKEHADRWMYHMENTLNVLENKQVLDLDSKQRMLNYFKHTAYFLHAGVSSQKS